MASNGGKMTIVCVDDHPIALQALVQCIRRILPTASSYAFDNVEAVSENKVYKIGGKHENR